MRAYRLKNDDVIIDVRFVIGEPMVRGIKVWCHRKRDYCFETVTTGVGVSRRLNKAETAALVGQLSLAVSAGLDKGARITQSPFEKKPWFRFPKIRLPGPRVVLEWGS